MYVLESERVKEKQTGMSEKIGSREKEQFIKRKAIKTSANKERKKKEIELENEMKRRKKLLRKGCGRCSTR